MPNHTKHLHHAAFLLCAAIGAAHAEDTQFTGVTAPVQSSSSWGLGIAGGVEKTTYKGADDKKNVIPLLMYDSRYVRVFGNVADFKLPSAGGVRFAVRAKYALGAGYEADDSPFLRGMEERKGSLLLGGAATWKTPYVTLSAQWLKATGNSKGQQAELTAEHSFRSGAVSITPRISAQWADDKYVDYYYGVRAGEATAWRPAYTGKATTDVGAGVRIDYAFRPNQLFLLDVSSTHRGSGISDSPLVERSNVPGVRLGYLYRF